MHVLLTDSLTCPRCGEEYPLVLLANRVENRRVLDGWLGCPNCRERFAVQDGFGDLRFGETVDFLALAESSPEAALRLAAMLAVTEGPATVLLIGGPAAHASALSQMIPQLEAIAVHPALSVAPERAGVSRMAVSQKLPFRGRSMRGVALGEGAAMLIEEAARVLTMRARLVVEAADDVLAERMTAAGLRIIAKDAQAIVAERTRI